MMAWASLIGRVTRQGTVTSPTFTVPVQATGKVVLNLNLLAATKRTAGVSCHLDVWSSAQDDTDVRYEAGIGFVGRPENADYVPKPENVDKGWPSLVLDVGLLAGRKVWCVLTIPTALSVGLRQQVF